MHRKIKSKNRKKLKPVDPFNTKSNLELKSKQKNLPPKDYEQEIPRSFRELFPSKEEKIKTEETKKKQKQKQKRDKNMIEGYERKTWETDKQFLNRVHRSTSDYVNDQLTKIKFGLVGFEPTDVLKLADEADAEKKAAKKRRQDQSIEEATSGTLATAKKRKVDHTTEIDRSKSAAIEKKSGETSGEGKKRRRKKQSEKRKEKKKERLDDRSDPLYMREVIPFGQRVDEPPQITSLPKKASRKQNSQQFHSRAGSKDLLLKKKLEPTTSATFDPDSHKRRYENDGTIKCEDAGKQRMLEQERRRVIEAYRAQKKERAERGGRGGDMVSDDDGSDSD